MINLTYLRLKLEYKICYKNFVVLLQVSKYNDDKISDEGGKEFA